MATIVFTLEGIQLVMSVEGRVQQRESIQTSRHPRIRHKSHSNLRDNTKIRLRKRPLRKPCKALENLGRTTLLELVRNVWERLTGVTATRQRSHPVLSNSEVESFTISKTECAPK